VLTAEHCLSTITGLQLRSARLQQNENKFSKTLVTVPIML